MKFNQFQILSGILLFVLVVFWLGSCRYDETFYEKDDAMIEFSQDTVHFDTVFTAVGSATRSFKIRNPYNDVLNLSRVYIEKGDESFFRINVNGINSNDVSDMEIPAKDSIYVFVEVTVDPDLPLSISPFVIEDYVHVEVNGNRQSILLEAWGQNANYIPNNRNKGGFALLTCDYETVTWDDPKPYVVYGILLIDSCTLELPPGCRVYVHGGIARQESLGTYNDGRIIILKEGSLKSNGTAMEPVIIQGDRLEPEFMDNAAQWSGLQIFPESKGNLLKYTTVLDAITGLSVDSAASVEIDGSQFYNHASRALVTYHPDNIKINNSLFHSVSSETVLLKYGGNIEINYSTIGSYDSQEAGLYVDNFRCTDPVFCAPVLVYPMNLKMANTIVAGNGSDELVLFDVTNKMEQDAFNFEMQNCLIKLDTILNVRNYPNFFDQCQGCASVQRDMALFANLDEDDFHLDTLSQAEMKAIPLVGVSVDLEGNMRDPVNPDVGCYEYQY